MRFRYGNRPSEYIDVDNSSIVFTNHSCSQISDERIQNQVERWYCLQYAILREVDFDFLKKNGLLKLVKVNQYGYEYYRFTQQAIAMDKTIYRPRVRHIEEANK